MDNSFEYTYSAPQQEEVRRIREKYLPKEEDKLEQLRRLDRNAVRKGSAAALSLGIIGALLLGGGMSCCLVWGGIFFLPGIVLGLIGMAVASLAYPLYARITQWEREKIAPEVLRLTEELLK